MRRTKLFLKFISRWLTILLLAQSCTKIDYTDPQELIKAYLEAFNNRDAERLRSLSLEIKSDEELNKVFTMWNNLNASVEVKSITEISKSETEAIVGMVLNYNLKVEGNNQIEEESREFLLTKENNQWKVKRGLL